MACVPSGAAVDARLVVSRNLLGQSSLHISGGPASLLSSVRDRFQRGSSRANQTLLRSNSPASSRPSVQCSAAGPFHEPSQQAPDASCDFTSLVSLDNAADVAASSADVASSLSQAADLGLASLSLALGVGLPFHLINFDDVAYDSPLSLVDPIKLTAGGLLLLAIILDHLLTTPAHVSYALAPVECRPGSKTESMFLSEKLGMGGYNSVFRATRGYQPGSRGSSWRTQAMQNDDLPPPAQMSYEDALKLLGVSDGASFDDILRAKKKKLETVGNDQELILRTEAAYDILLMQSLSRRRAGKVVDYSVKYADVRKAGTPPPKPAWMQAVARVTSLTIAKPDPQDLAIRAGVFAALAVWTYAAGLSQPESLSQYGTVPPSVPGLQLALGIGASIYFLRKDNVGLGKAAALSFSSLIFGGLFGSLLDAWLRVDIFPLLGISSSATLIGETSTIFLALACLFFR